MVENKLRRTIFVITLGLLISILGVVPHVNFAILRATQADLFVRRMPFEARYLLLMELKLVQVVSWHTHVPYRHEAVFTGTCKHVFIDGIESTAVECLYRDLTLADGLGTALSQVPSKQIIKVRNFVRTYIL